MLLSSFIIFCSISTVLSQIDCTCTNDEDWQCTDYDGNTYTAQQAGYSECVDERSDIWVERANCKYCYKCVGSAGSGGCECDVQENCEDTIIIVGIILLILGILFMLWQGFILYRFFSQDGEMKDVWRICGCFVLGLVLIIIGITMIADQSLWFGIFS